MAGRYGLVAMSRPQMESSTHLNPSYPLPSSEPFWCLGRLLLTGVDPLFLIHSHTPTRQKQQQEAPIRPIFAVEASYCIVRSREKLHRWVTPGRVSNPSVIRPIYSGVSCTSPPSRLSLQRCWPTKKNWRANRRCPLVSVRFLIKA